MPEDRSQRVKRTPPRSIVARVALSVIERVARKDHEVIGPCGHLIKAGEKYVLWYRTSVKWCYRCYEEITSQEDMQFKS